MANYVDVDGKKFVQLDDGILAPVYVGLSLEGGTLVNLRADQLLSLRSPVLPTTFPLPDDQVTLLRSLTLTGFPSAFAVNNFPASYQVSNFPASFQVSNFPAAYQVSNLPAEYPLSASQALLLSQTKDQVVAFAKGSGSTDANTLRFRLATDQPTIAVSSAKATTQARTSVNLSTTVVTLSAADANRKSLSIYNDSTGILHVAIGVGASLTDFTTKLYQDDSYELPEINAQLQITGIWSAGSGAARITATS